MWNILFAIFPTIFNVRIRMFVQMCKWLHWYEHTNSRCRVTSHTRIQIHICAHTHIQLQRDVCARSVLPIVTLMQLCNTLWLLIQNFLIICRSMSWRQNRTNLSLRSLHLPTNPSPSDGRFLQLSLYVRTYHYLHLSICECKRASNYDCRTHVCMYACISVNHMFERLPYDVPLPLNGDRRTVTHWDESHCFIFSNCGSSDKKVK